VETLNVIGWLSLVKMSGYDGKYAQLLYWDRNGENNTPTDDYSKYWIINKKNTSK